MSTSMELFTGAGGLALGLHRAGFEHLLLVEHSSKACATLRHNFRRSLRGGRCELHEGDVRDVTFARFAGEVDVLAAGASCQPFSIGGLHRAHVDDRNVFPAVFQAQREAGPKAVIVENVKGLVRTGFSDYVRYIELQLAMPELPAPDEDGPEAWRHHLPKLLKASRGTRRGQGRLRYVVRRAVMNAADYGIGQHRERVFFVALRADLHRAWEPPAATHGRDRLLFDQYVTGAYWKRHGLEDRRVPTDLRSRIEVLAKHSDPPPLKAWVTLRDCLSGMPRPARGRAPARYPQHVFRPGARPYAGHTGSTWDEPAKTVKAGVHGVPGGENSVRHVNGKVRYLTIREAARLQSFPDDWVFDARWTSAMRQIGNAVPVRLAERVAASVDGALRAKRGTHTRGPDLILEGDRTDQ